jgi:hypothetical protein
MFACLSVRSTAVIRMTLALTVFLLIAAAAACGEEEEEAPPRAGYEVRVHFNETVTQEDQQEAHAVLAAYDPDLEFLVLELFPPIGVARLSTGRPDLCGLVESELSARAYVREVTCNFRTDESPVASPGEPVSND